MNLRDNLMVNMLEETNSPFQKVIFGVLFFILVYFIYAPLFSSPFYHDDIIVIVSNSWIHHVPPGTWFAQGYADSDHIFHVYRPTLIFSYWINQLLIPGTLEFSLRLGSLILLILNGCIVTRIAWMVLEKDRYLSWFIGLIYILHPIQTLGVVYVWKRSSLLCVFFILMGLYSSVRRIKKNAKYDYKFILFQMVCFAGAITSKEEGIVYPLILSACELLFHSGQSMTLRKKYLLMGFHLAVLGTVDLLVHRYTAGHLWQVIFEPSRLDYLRQSLAILPVYFQNMIIPRPILYAEPVGISGWVNFYSCSTILLLLVSCVFLFSKSTSKIVKLAVFLIWIGFLPNSSFQPLLFIMDQIRMHLPIVGFSMLLVYLISRLDSKKISCLLCGLICMLYAAQDFRQSLRYMHPLSVWKDIVSQYPHSRFAWNQLGSILEIKEDYRSAAQAYTTAYEIDPQQKDQLILALMNRWKGGESKSQIEKECRAIDLSGAQNNYAYFQMAILQMQLGMVDEAERTTEQFLKFYPTHARAYFLLGTIYERKHLYTQSRSAYENALRLNPSFESAREALTKLPNA